MRQSQAARDAWNTASLYFFSVPDIQILQMGAGEMAHRTWIQSPTPTWYDGSQPFIIPVPRIQCPLSDFHGYQACTWYTYIHTGTTPSHIKQRKSNCWLHSITHTYRSLVPLLTSLVDRKQEFHRRVSTRSCSTGV